MPADKKKLTQIGEIGKFGLIDRLTKSLNIKNSSTIFGPGDDSAVVNYENRLTVTSLKVMNEGIDFNLVYYPLKHLGYKAVVSAISNIYAMNAVPRQLLTGISLSNRFSVEAVEELYLGIHAACDKYNLDLIGGDTKSSLSGLSISVNALGDVTGENLVYRKGAQPNDLLCITGNLGAAYLGLQLLEREKAIFEDNKEMQPDLTGHEYILSRQLKPEIPLTVLDKLSELKITPSAMIDITDGLAQDLLQLCKSSNVGCKIYQDKIPIDKETQEAAGEFNLEPTTCALNGGEDYELMFTVPVGLFEIINELSDVSIIGHVTPKNEGCQLITINNEAIELAQDK